MFSRTCGLVLALSVFNFYTSVKCQSISDCTELSTLLPGRVSFPGTTEYASSIASYFFLNQRLEPACVVFPSSVQDVTSIVRRIAATTSNTTFSIRGGGHAPNVGAANAVGGVTVDLTRLNSVSLSQSGSVVSIGGGARWEHVYPVLDQRNLSVVGARVSNVGVGGLTTGGGISTFSLQHGWACDNVVYFQIVLASGAIINANQTSNADLFAALKGGQNNFGVVTRFDMRTFPQGNLWGGGIRYENSATAAQLAAFTDFKNPANFDPFIGIEQSFLFVGSQAGLLMSSNNMYYTRPIVNASSLQRFTSIQPQIRNTMRISNTTDFTAELGRNQPQNQFAVYATATFRISPTILNQVHSLWNSSLSQLSGITNLTAVLTFQSIPRPPPATGPQNSLGFPPASQPQKDLVLCLVSNYWPLSSDTVAVQQVTESLTRAIKQITTNQGLAIPFTYLGYAASWQDPLGSYGSAQLAALRQVARKYDPNGVFQRNVPGGFKLFS